MNPAPWRPPFVTRHPTRWSEVESVRKVESPTVRLAECPELEGRFCLEMVVGGQVIARRVVGEPQPGQVIEIRGRHPRSGLLYRKRYTDHRGAA